MANTHFSCSGQAAGGEDGEQNAGVRSVLLFGFAEDLVII
jgi:hypothetical protein